MVAILRRVSLQGSISAVVLATAVWGISGCGGAGDGFKGSYGSVSGKVTYKGEPLPADCSVFFQAEQGGYAGVGTTNAQGEYTLPAKLPAVKYRIQLGVMLAGGPPTIDPKNSDDAKPTAGPPFPQKYGDFGTSKLEYTVTAGENKNVNFDLED